MGYTDIGRAAFGRVGGIGINALYVLLLNHCYLRVLIGRFCLELFALG